MSKFAELGNDSDMSGEISPRASADTVWDQFVAAQSERRLLIHALAILIFVAATSAATFSQHFQRPITAAIVYLLGVTLVGALEGLKSGLIAAICASLIYNFFLSDPVFRFSLTSAEEYVPLIAFNLSAAASALLVGRLKDRAMAAELANRRMHSLLEVSQKLQAAVHVHQIPEAISDFTGSDPAEIPEIYVVEHGSPAPIQSSSRHSELAKQLLQEGRESIGSGLNRAFLLGTPALPIGVLVHAQGGHARRGLQEHDLAAFVNLLGIALERCLLLERLSEAELIKRSEEFKTALLSSVSHDMRTPLGAISASASSLASFGSELTEDTRADLLAMIQEQCERLDRYTTNLLNLGRIQSGVDPKLFTECDALDVLGAAISRTRMIDDAPDIRKAYDVPSALVRADPVMLEQVFYNVLENAVRYSPAASRIEVTSYLSASDVTISISDFGPGIAPDDLKRVFDRFYRSQSALNEKGSGLGLSIAKGFTEAFGGSIEAGRADGAEGGTTVKIRLPLAAGGAKA